MSDYNLFILLYINMDKLKTVHTIADIKSVLKNLDLFRWVVNLEQEFKDIDGLIQTLENNNITHLSAIVKKELERNILEMIEGKIIALSEKLKTHIDRINAVIAGTSWTTKTIIGKTFLSGRWESGSRSTGESGYRTSTDYTPSRSSESSWRSWYSG